jgi:hypothetical protein
MVSRHWVHGLHILIHTGNMHREQDPYVATVLCYCNPDMQYPEGVEREDEQVEVG